jgi:hypothetical protein
MGADELILMTTSLRTWTCDCWDFNRLSITNIDRLLDTFFLSTEQFLVPHQHWRAFGKGNAYTITGRSHAWGDDSLNFPLS